MLIDKKITIKINNRYINYYKEKGYKNVLGGKLLTIKIEDLPDNSHYKIKVKCDKCIEENEIKYYNYFLNITKNKKYICNKCKGETIVKSNLLKYGVKSTLELDYVKEKSKNEEYSFSDTNEEFDEVNSSEY